MAVLSLLGKLCDAVACGDSSGYKGYALDLASATHNLPGATPLWMALSTNVAADYANSDETYQFHFAGGTGSDGTDINAGEAIHDETPAMNGNNAKLATAGNFIVRRTMDMAYRALRYFQLKYTQAGTSNAITVDFNLSLWMPRTDYNIQVTASNVGLP